MGNIKLDIKTILVLIFLGCSVVFFGMWYFKGSDTKKQVKDLEKQVKIIQMDRDSLKKINLKLNDDFVNKDKEIADRVKKINEIESLLNRYKRDYVKINNELIKSQKDLLDMNRKIEDLKKNPIKREGDDLINSFKEKLNK